MESVDDSALLRQYCDRHSDDAFAALVTRHINLVYSVALRQVANPHHAEEITQAVFIILARKAAGLRHDKALSSWLFQTTHLTAMNFIRSEMRRHRREQEAHMQSMLEEPESGVWERITPLLDAAVAALKDKDRRAIVLRFYERRSLSEVAAALGTTEEASRKRVNRALEKLQNSFAKRGVNSTAATIAETISTNSVQAAPVALAKTVAAVAAAKGAVASTSTLTLIKGALKLMAWSKAKTTIAVAAAAALILATGGGYLAFSHNRHSSQPGRLKLPAGELAPAVSFGRSHGLILAPDGGLWSWGENDLGWPALGLGNTKNIPYLKRIGTDNDWVAIAAGANHNLALKKDGSIWSWGENLYDELGTHPAYLRPPGRVNAVSNSSAVPIESALGNDWKMIAAGGANSFGIKTDGTLWAWGLNDFGQLGIGSFTDQPAPVQIGSATWTKVQAGFINGAGIQTDGSLWIWGGGPTVGNTAPRSPQHYSSPVRVSDDTNWLNIAVGDNVVFALNSDGTVRAWGKAAELYTGTPNAEAKMTQIGNDNDWAGISCSGSRYLVLTKKDASLWAMSSTNQAPAQLKHIDLQKDIVAIGGGPNLGVALTRDGEVWTWGKTIGEDVMKIEGSGKNVHEIDPKFHVFNEPWQLSNR